MSTTIPSASSTPTGDRKAGAPRDVKPRLRPAPRRRNVPWLVVGVLLVVGCALTFAVTSMRVGGRRPVLAVTHAVPAGHVLTTADLQVLRVAAGPKLQLIPAVERPQVIGQPVSVPLTGGSLLTQAAVEPATYPPDGQAIVGVPLEAGRYPPALTAGARVGVVVTEQPALPTTSGQSTSPSSRAVVGTRVADATVTAFNPGGDTTGARTVVALRLPDRDATDVAAAAAAGQVSLVLLSPASGGGEQ